MVTGLYNYSYLRLHVFKAAVSEADRHSSPYRVFQHFNLARLMGDKQAGLVINLVTWQSMKHFKSSLDEEKCDWWEYWSEGLIVLIDL